jgi:hypothetical protein
MVAVEIPSEKYESCLKFLVNFKNVYTLNYDLLLYWASLHVQEEKEEFPFLDCFDRSEDPEHPDCSFAHSSSDDKKYLYFLHGALHLYTKNGLVWKRVWRTTSIPIIKQVKEAFDSKEYPLTVTEGSFQDKIKRIEASSYLSYVYRKFKNIRGHLFVFGHSLCEQDDHLLQAIVNHENIGLNHLWVGLFGNPSAPYNKKIIAKAHAMQLQRDRIIPERSRKKAKGNMNIYFYNSESAHVWE